MTLRDREMENRKMQYPEFLNNNRLNAEQLNDPDFRLKELQKISGGITTITCSSTGYLYADEVDGL
jgi:hypothetical protein